MQLKTKKIIAREFLFSIVAILLVILCHFSIYGYNYYLDFRSNTIDEEAGKLKTDADYLSEPYLHKKGNQQKFYRELTESFSDVRAYDSDELWQKLNSLQQESKLHSRYAAASIEYKKYLEKWDIYSAENYTDFVGFNLFSAEDLDSKAKADSLISRRDNLLNEAYNLRDDKLEDIEHFNTTLLAAAIILGFVFVVRYLFYAIAWSIKILRQPNQASFQTHNSISKN